jgi:hypothetical protein
MPLVGNERAIRTGRNERRAIRLVCAMLLEQNDERAVQRRYMTLETLDALSDDAARRPRRITTARSTRPTQP